MNPTSDNSGSSQVQPLAFGEVAELQDQLFEAATDLDRLGGLLEDYRGSYILTFAGYNAGRGSVKKWIERYGHVALTGEGDEFCSGFDLSDADGLDVEGMAALARLWTVALEIEGAVGFSADEAQAALRYHARPVALGAAGYWLYQDQHRSGVQLNVGGRSITLETR